MTGRKFPIHSDFLYFDFLLKSLPSQCQEHSELGIFFAFSNCLTSVCIKRPVRRTSLAVQCLRLCSSNAEGMGSILVGELRSQKLQVEAEKKKYQKKKKSTEK